MSQPHLVPSRWQEITQIWRDNRWLYVIAGWLLGLLSYPALQRVNGDVLNLLHDLVPESVGILFTVLILNRLAENRATEQLKTRLIREARSQSNETAKAAVDWMRHSGWLTQDDSLLIDVDLSRANLQEADLGEARLDSTNMAFASLEKANLREASLENVNLVFANLRDATLRSANLYRARLTHANLCGADLRYADLRNVNLNGVEMDENTILPDDTRWSKEVDLSRFTNPQHPDSRQFW